MSLYLLKGSDNAVSMTSLSVFGVGFFIFLISFHLRNKPAIALRGLTALCVFILGILSILFVHTLSPFPEDSILGWAIRGLGRDMTLSGRTEIWTDVLKVASRDPLFGVGYGGFWIGRTANIPWDELLSSDRLDRCPVGPRRGLFRAPGNNPIVCRRFRIWTVPHDVSGRNPFC